MHGNIESDCLTPPHLWSCILSAALQILAKLASGMYKPSQQTLVPLAAVPGLLKDLPIPKLRQLGGKFGDELMASLNIKTVGERSNTWAPRDYACLACHVKANGRPDRKEKEQSK